MVSALIAMVFTAPLSASEALAISALLAQMDNGFTLKLQAGTLSVIEQAEEIRKAS